MAPSALQYMGAFLQPLLYRRKGQKQQSRWVIPINPGSVFGPQSSAGAWASRPSRGEVAPVGPVCLPAFAMETTPGLCAFYTVVSGAPLDSPDW